MADAERRKEHLEERIRRERRAVLVVNTRSRRGARLRPKAEALLTARGFTLDRVYAVTDPSRLDEVLAEAMAARPPLLVLGSGDGTVSSVVDHLAGTDTVLGYLPMGTTNNLARSLGLPLRLPAAVRVLAEGHVVDVDLGVADGDYFANMASLGVSVAVSDLTPHLLKRRLGRLAYAMTGAAALRNSAPFSATVTVDGVEYRIRTHQLNIANGSVHAGTRIAVDAGIDDGLLTAYPLGGPGRWSAARATAGQALTPNRTLARKGHLTGEQITVVTDPPQLVEIDGETSGSTPIELHVARNALLIMVPASFHDS
jgi:diacylglycerol kinase family enzyme